MMPEWDGNTCYSRRYSVLQITFTNLQVREGLLDQTVLGDVRGGQDAMAEAKALGQTYNAFRLTNELDPYSPYFKCVNDAAICGVATVQGDSTATSVKEIAEATPSWIESTWSSFTASFNGYLVTTAEVWASLPSQLLQAAGS